ncbi:alpha-amylase family glycosyl hydrolase [Lachnospiraceae bacterium YH-ros2228]
MPKWLKDAVFYEIYPQSFYDSNGDGIGDLNGIIEKLDYVKGLGCNALWLNPFYDSPFRDAGYDVRDYKKVAPRYGTNEDAKRLFEEAHKRGIHILIDLVPGHTSDEHEWFRESKKAEKNPYSDRYVWTNGAFSGIEGHPYIAGASERDGCYMLNFFAFQPALNYGFGKVTKDWQKSWDDPACQKTREAMKDVMRFWLDLGCDGFRCDMADSLVKDDDDFDKEHVAMIWRDVRAMLDRDYPEAALVSEWSNPRQAIVKGGFHMDFYLDHWNNGYNSLVRDYEPHPKEDRSYFKKDAGGDINRFLDDYINKYNSSRDKGYISFLTSNHDTPRPKRTLTDEELKLFYAFVLTMPGVPFLYYGDEIGMRYLNLPSKEGGFQRTGSRTPMQWDDSRNKGFSTADPEKLYLPVDDAEGAPSVQAMEGKADSLLETTRSLIKLRHEEEDLQADAAFRPLYSRKGQPYIYQRGDLILAINPDGEKKEVIIPEVEGRKIRFSIHEVGLKGACLTMGSQSFAVLKG